MARVNISRLARQAIVQELSERAKIAAAYAYLDELDRELGPISPQDQARADAEVRRIVGGTGEARESA